MIPVKRMIPGKIAALLIIFLTKSCQAEEPIGLSDPKSENLKDYTSTISFKNVDLKSGKFCSNGVKNVGSIKISLLSRYKVTRVIFRDSKNDQRPFEIEIFGGDDNELESVKSHKFVSAAKNESIPVNTGMSDVMIEIKSADNLPLNCFYLELFISNEVVEPTVKTQNDCLKLGCEQSCEYRFLNAFYLKCKCNDGYQLDSNGKNCSDINECNLNKCDKKTTTCHNTIGSFYCSCLDDTMELDSKNKNLQCIDRDECKINNGGCQQQCVNLNNGFRCDCYSGFEKINGSCQDKNECQNPFQCNSETSECINTLGGFYCKCLPGYEASLRNGCQDIDECKKKISGCTHYCTNTKGSYLCSCNRGYYLHSDNHTCIDIDECSSGEANCDVKTTSCKNRPGTFDCSCKTGYTSYNKTSCTDINECQLANGSCQKGCVNTIGSYYCTCPSGLKLAKDKKMCDDVAECSEPKLNNCEQNCYETYGSFYCGCKKGFYLNSDQKSCQDENECIKNEGRGECEQECENTIGSFKCSCKKGWKLSSDGSTCQDFNECQHINNLCNAVTSNCLNTQGSYECQCKRGYFKDKITGECTGILCRPYPLLQNGKIYPEKCTQPNAMRYTDECKFECNPGYELNAKSASSASCNVDGTWSFNQGGYEPKCEGVRCSNISAVANGDIVPSTCLTNGASYGETCTLYCKGGYDHIGPHEAICEKDGKFSHLLQESKCIERKKLVCPHDINLVLPLGKKEMAIPLSIFEELEKFEGVVSDPQGVLNGTYMFKSRRSSYLITLVNKYKDSCNFYVTIEDREPPTVTNCPNDKVFVSIIGEQGIVNWPEPVFSDNVGVKKVINNLQNNAYLSQQVYFVFYEAIDDYGNQAACRFFVHVRAKHCSKNSIPGGEGASKSWFSSSASQATVLLQCPVGFIFSEVVAPTPVFFCNNGEWVSRQVPDCVKRTNPTNGSCALGEIQLVHPTTKQIMCGLCPKGTEAGNIPGTCQKCLVGFYQDVEGSLKCKRCPDGQLTSTNGQKSALSCEVPCGAGKYSLTGFDGVDGCKRCPSGSYQELEGQIACKICHQSATSENGSVTEDQCRLSARVSKIIPESELILASVGDNITLDCYGTGSPAPHLMFVKEKSLNNNETQSVMTMESLATGNRYITGLRVMIKNVKEADSGIYVCKADNRLTSTGAIDGRSIFVQVSKNINDVN